MRLLTSFLSAAKHQGWSEEEIVEFWQKDATLAKKTFDKMYEATNFISQQASDFARQRRKQMQEDLKGNNKDGKPAYKKLDIESIKKEYGDDVPEELFKVLQAQDGQMEQMFDAIQDMKSQNATSEQASQEETVLIEKMQSFFEAKSKTGYDQFYGKTERGQRWNMVLTGEQLKSRTDVIEEADSIFAGFELRGKPISYDEALERAHMIVGDKVREKSIREDIGKKIKKRNKGLTVKSTKVKKSKDVDDDDKPPKDPKKRDGWLQRRTLRRLKKSGGGKSVR